MACIGINWLYQGKKLNGINADIQIGFALVNGFYTMVVGLEYSRYSENVGSQVITPKFAYSISSKFFNHLQVKTGYNIGLISMQKSGFYFGVNTQILLTELIGF
jgi:hypothetical protein